MAYQRPLLPNPELPPSARCQGQCTNPDLIHNPKEWTERWYEAIGSLTVIQKVPNLPWTFERLRSNGHFLSVEVQNYRKLLRGGSARDPNGKSILFNPDEFNLICIKLRWQMRMARETCLLQFGRISAWFKLKGRRIFTCHEAEHFSDWFDRLSRKEFRDLILDYEDLEFPTLAEVTKIRLMQGFNVSRIPHSSEEVVGCGPLPEDLHRFMKPTKSEAEMQEIEQFVLSLSVRGETYSITSKSYVGSRFSCARALNYGSSEPEVPYEAAGQDPETMFGPLLPKPKRKRSRGALQEPEDLSEKEDFDMDGSGLPNSDLPKYQIG